MKYPMRMSITISQTSKALQSQRQCSVTAAGLIPGCMIQWLSRLEVDAQLVAMPSVQLLANGLRRQVVALNELLSDEASSGVAGGCLLPKCSVVPVPQQWRKASVGLF
jgi:hypothetical protein